MLTQVVDWLIFPLKSTLNVFLSNWITTVHIWTNLFFFYINSVSTQSCSICIWCEKCRWERHQLMRLKFNWQFQVNRFSFLIIFQYNASKNWNALMSKQSELPFIEARKIHSHRWYEPQPSITYHYEQVAKTCVFYLSRSIQRKRVH